MKIAAVFLSGLLAVAPTASACACPAGPRAERMGCEGTSHCCCGDASDREASHDACPRAEPVVDTLDQPAALSLDLPGFFALPASILPALPEAPGFLRPVDDGRSRASPSRPLFLLCSVFLL